MNASCQPMPQQLANEMLQIVARALCERPGDSIAQRDSRTLQMVLSVLGFVPRDGLEYMLSSMAVGHFHLILDSMRDVFHGQDDKLKEKTKTTIVALNRAMLETVREMRLEQKRLVDRSAEAPRREEAEAEAVMPAASPEVPPGRSRVEEDAVEPVPAMAASEETGVVETGVADSEPARLVAVQADDREAETTGAGGQLPAVAMRGTPPLVEAGEASEERALAAMAAVMEIVTRAAALENATAGTASGD